MVKPYNNVIDLAELDKLLNWGKKSDALLFLQPVEMDYSQDLTKHGVVLEEFSLLKVLTNISCTIRRTRGEGSFH
ncbi:hypothetical protein Sjap_023628 [Stephania japonica]|uniref:Uncharacterized protein n=1 Tax=Stephania japonica TaxID=461633 RepID=A0AAP0HN57_9MAGN